MAGTATNRIEQADTQEAIDDELLAYLIQQHRSEVVGALERLWDYYRNDLDFSDASDGANRRSYRTAQEQGLPARLQREPSVAGVSPDGAAGNREIVIENDIAWRIHTLVDFMFGRPVTIQSLAGDGELAELIERVLNAVFEANGGICFWQDMALLGGVYGYVDVLLRVDGLAGETRSTPAPRGGLAYPGLGLSGSSSSDGSGAGEGSAHEAPSKHIDAEPVLRLARKMTLETVEAPRIIPVLDPSDYRRLNAYVLHYTQQLNEVDRGSFLGRLVDWDGRWRGRLATVDVTEVWTADRLVIRHDDETVAELPNRLGRIPVVHIQNLPQPFFYEGLSEVEPLIPLQDELNTRLSDRANRVTFQAFKMYLGKGIDGFLDRPVGPGQMWATDNLDASIETFGGDSASPSEDAHITEIREAMDKTSSVTPLAAGLLRDKVGNLTSENALRMVMMGLLSKTDKKRVTYGQGIERLCEMILGALHVWGVLQTRPEDRRIKLHWPSALPENTTQRLKDAELKLKIGVPAHEVLAELGYTAAQAAAAK